MKLLFEFFPILLFFIVFKLKGIYWATGVAIIASFIQVIIHRVKTKKYDMMQLATLGIIVIFGGATILLHDEMFIKWKPTVLYWLFALAFIISHFTQKTLIQRMMGKAIELPGIAWKKMSLSWILFFILLGALNLFVAYHYSTDIWVDFKLFGILGFTLAFVLLQSVFLSKYLKHE